VLGEREVALEAVRDGELKRMQEKLQNSQDKVMDQLFFYALFVLESACNPRGMILSSLLSWISPFGALFVPRLIHA
jgi:hypothetical protein